MWSPWPEKGRSRPPVRRDAVSDCSIVEQVRDVRGGAASKGPATRSAAPWRGDRREPLEPPRTRAATALRAPSGVTPRAIGTRSRARHGVTFPAAPFQPAGNPTLHGLASLAFTGSATRACGLGLTPCQPVSRPREAPRGRRVTPPRPSERLGPRDVPIIIATSRLPLARGKRSRARKPRRGSNEHTAHPRDASVTRSTLRDAGCAQALLAPRSVRASPSERARGSPPQTTPRRLTTSAAQVHINTAVPSTTGSS